MHILAHGKSYFFFQKPTLTTAKTLAVHGENLLVRLRRSKAGVFSRCGIRHECRLTSKPDAQHSCRIPRPVNDNLNLINYSQSYIHRPFTRQLMAVNPAPLSENAAAKNPLFRRQLPFFPSAVPKRGYILK